MTSRPIRTCARSSGACATAAARSAATVFYFYDAAPAVPEAWFFNPDGSAAEFCGNGMRCLGRVILDRRGIDTAEIRSGYP